MVKEHNTIKGFIGGYGFRSAIAWLRCVGAELWGRAFGAGSGAGLSKAYHISEYLPYRGLTVMAPLSPSNYAVLYPERAATLYKAVQQHNTSAFKYPCKQYSQLVGFGDAIAKKQMFEDCFEYSPDKEHFDLLLEVSLMLSHINSQFVKDYKRAYGRISMARRTQFHIRIHPVSHAAVSVVKVGSDPVMVIPWESLSYTSELELKGRVRRSILNHPQLGKHIQRLRKHLDGTLDDEYWSKSL